MQRNKCLTDRLSFLFMVQNNRHWWEKFYSRFSEQGKLPFKPVLIGTNFSTIWLLIRLLIFKIEYCCAYVFYMKKEEIVTALSDLNGENGLIIWFYSLEPLSQQRRLTGSVVTGWNPTNSTRHNSFLKTKKQRTIVGHINALYEVWWYGKDNFTKSLLNSFVTWQGKHATFSLLNSSFTTQLSVFLPFSIKHFHYKVRLLPTVSIFTSP